MIRTILLSTAFALFIGLTKSLLLHTRVQETAPSGDPVLRYLAAPYVMLCCALFFVAVGIYQWFDPINHRYSGNLMLLSYIPTALGLCAIGVAGYCFTYRATLRQASIEISCWPFGTTRFNLSDLEAVASKGPNTILHFSRKKKFVVNGMLSGRANFLSTLSANKSVRSNPFRGSD
jgi:hypothetical protein